MITEIDKVPQAIVIQHRPSLGGDNGPTEITDGSVADSIDNQGLKTLWLNTRDDREVLLPGGTPAGFRVVIPQTYRAEGYDGDNPWGSNVLSTIDDSTEDQSDQLQRTILASVRRGIDRIPPNLRGLVPGDDEIDIAVMKPTDFPFFTSISAGVSIDGAVKIQVMLGERQSDEITIDDTMEQRAEGAVMVGILGLFEQRNPDLKNEWVQRGGSKPNEDENSLSGAMVDFLYERAPKARISNEDGTAYKLVPVTKEQMELLRRLFDTTGRNFDTINGAKILWTSDLSSSGSARWIAVQ